MRFHRPDAEIFVPDNLPEKAALGRVTHLAVGAHQDDLEFMAFQGIEACFGSEREWFGGVTCTDGAGSVRVGNYARFDDAAMKTVRHREQNLAAQIGRYGVMIQLGYSSVETRDSRSAWLRDDLASILRATHPRIVYTHNLADKHETHIGVAVATIQALRSLPADERPAEVYGCEVWRSLDWMLDAEKVVHPVSGAEHLAAALNGVFDSQIAGGKRYDLGVMGRRLANATFHEPRAVDRAAGLAFAMDLTPLVRDDTLDVAAYVDGFIERFRADVRGKLLARLGETT